MMRQIAFYLAALFVLLPTIARADGNAAPHRFLYIATPGVSGDLRYSAQYGGQGIIVLDMDNAHRFVKRLPFASVDARNRPLEVRGICASAATGRLYVSSTVDLTCIDLASDKLLWKKAYDGGCDRMAVSPDGKTIYLPTLKKKQWNVIDAITGDVLASIVTNSGTHNTIYALDGKHVYLAGLQSRTLTIAQTDTNTAEKSVGPFGGFIRPFTVNGKGTLGFMCVDGLLGFEVGDLNAGKVLYRVQVQGFKTGPVKRHACPSHGIALTPDEKELWVNDSFNSRIHVFDATVMPPKQLQSIPLRDQPGWITFSIDGTLAYTSSGDIIDAKAHQVIGVLKDEKDEAIESEKLLEIDFAGAKPSAAGNQFGVGQVR